MQLTRAWLTLGLSMLVGCGGSVTREGEQPSTGGSAGVGSSGGGPTRGGAGGSSGSVAKGGTGNGGDISYGAYGGALGGYSGDISYGGTAGYGASSGDAGQAGVGGGCGPSTTTAGPYPVQFLFTSNMPVYVQEDCLLNYDLFSCNSGAIPIVHEASCVAECSSNSPMGCLECGACARDAKLIGPGAPLQDYWDGSIYKYGTLASGCPCTTAANAAPGVYSLSISEFFSESDAMTNTNPYPRTVQFELPAPNGVVTVDLGFQGD